MSLLQMSFAGAIIILAVTSIRAAGMNKLPKTAFLVLWGVALVRLLIPYAVPSAFSVYSLWDRLVAAAGVQNITPAETPVGNIIPISPIQNAAPGAAVPVAPAASPFVPRIDPWVVIWMIGMLACGLFIVVSYFRCRKEFKESLPVDNDASREWLEAHRLNRPIAIRYSDRISAPLTYGILRPVILMPKTADWNDLDSLKYVLAHEYVHIRRFDAVTKLVLTVALCIHWFNPAVWLMYVLANRDIELSCDETVVRQFGERTKAAYAMTLIRMEETRSGLSPLCNSFSKNAIEERIVAIMKMKKTSMAALLVALALVVCVTAGFATSAQATPGKTADEKTTDISPNAAQVTGEITVISYADPNDGKTDDPDLQMTAADTQIALGSTEALESVSMNETAVGEQPQAGGSTVAAGAEGFIWPVNCTYITSAFGYLVHPIFGTTKYHSGVDVDAGAGQTIMAAADGTVSIAEESDSYGYYCVIDHSNGTTTLYAHMNAMPSVSVGQTVSAGQTIGYVGSTGWTTGPHLHFEIRENVSCVDPISYFPEIGFTYSPTV